MRIQHNIMAMNAYRNYNLNNKALAGNLEKLSSGYKINRAGDDAAGLAISEKMRAQIAGLEAAQKNVKDGTSLVKTAEGAMQEVQDMLNRMVTLATQSANGTYDNDTDRAALQQEVDQLNSEINRIAESANFNGIKLLDGSLDTTRRATTVTTFSGLTHSTNVNGTADTTLPGTGFGGAGKNGKLELTGGDLKAGGTTELYKSDMSIRYHKDAAESGKTSFTVNLGNLTDFNVATGTELKDMIFGLDSGKKPGTADNTATGTTNNCLFLTKEAGAGADAAAIEKQKLTYSVTASNGKITGEDIAKAVMDAIEKNGGKVYIEPNGEDAAGKRIEYTVTRDGDKLNFEMTDQGYADAAELQDAAGNTVNYFQGNYSFNVDYKTAGSITGTTDSDTAEKNFISHIDVALRGNDATCNINEGTTPADTVYAQAYIRFDNAATAGSGYNKATDLIKDGKGFQFGDEYYLFAGTDKTFNTEYGDNVKVVDIRNLDMTKDDDLRKALDRLSVAADGNEMFDVQVGKPDGKGKYYLVLNERTDYAGDANLTHKNFGLENQIKTFDNSTSKTTVEKEAGKELTLQIGDTSEEFNQLKVNIGDIHAAALGVDKISVATQEDAGDAIDVIRAAINKVSSIRGTLGATQNRLDHTANNLSVMAENIQDAESTIRDTDVAEEMMSYVKNNILVQSAQAMLAQANQLPQGVLQLLG